MAESKYGRLFTEADVVNLLRYAHDRAFTAGMIEEGAGGLEGDDPRMRPPVVMEAEANGITLTFPPDEPLFLLRGQDRAALAAVSFYAQNCRAIQAGADHCAAVLTAYEQMHGWQAANPDRVKVPD